MVKAHCFISNVTNNGGKAYSLPQNKLSQFKIKSGYLLYELTV